MTEQEQRIAIAETTGHVWYWFVNGVKDGSFTWRLKLAPPPEEGVGKSWTGQSGETAFADTSEIANAKRNGDFDLIAPDYLHDLNAMHEAENTLIGNHEDTYVRHLTHALFVACCKTQTYDFGLCHATASQRAEAFLRTKGLWKEDSVEGPTAAQCNDILGKPGHYKP